MREFLLKIGSYKVKEVESCEGKDTTAEREALLDG
jgi:hypothetical protein